jgi:transposase InsO family protein
VNEMIDIHRDSEGTYGSPRVTAALRRQGYCVNHKRAERLMGTYGIVGLVERRRRPRTTMAAEGAPPLPDLIGQDFRPGEPDRRWCGDITYVPTGEGWLYLASVLDLGSRRLIGWAMDATMPTGLVSGALERAVDLRGGDIAGVIFHTDRGSQGEINWSSQHLDSGGGIWRQCENASARFRSIEVTFLRQAGPALLGGKTELNFGRPLLAA